MPLIPKPRLQTNNALCHAKPYFYSMPLIPNPPLQTTNALCHAKPYSYSMPLIPKPHLQTTNALCHNEPMDTLYVKNVKRDSYAREVGLRKNDRILAVNDQPVTGCSYSEVMSLINHWSV